MSDPLLIAEIDRLEHEIKRLRAALATARAALENISDNGGDTLTIEDAVRISDAALASLEQKP